MNHNEESSRAANEHALVQQCAQFIALYSLKNSEVHVKHFIFTTSHIVELNLNPFRRHHHACSVNISASKGGGRDEKGLVEFMRKKIGEQIFGLKCVRFKWKGFA